MTEQIPPAQLRYILLGAAADAERRSRATLAAGARIASVAARPASTIWRSRLNAPVRERVDQTTRAWGRDGLLVAQQGRTRAAALTDVLARRLGDELAGSGLADEVVDWLLSSGAFDRVVTVVINHPATEALVANALDDPGLDRLIARVMDSRLVDEITARLLDSEEMQLMLDYITSSPELRAALARQTAGLAGDVAVGVRARTVVADDATERFARRLLGRRRRPASE